MAKFKFSILLMILSKVAIAGEKNTSFVDVEFVSELSAETLSQLLPVTVMVNDNDAVTAWLDLRKSYKFIFENKTQTTLELADALKTLSPARSLRFSCAKSELELCQKYSQFNFGYDFETGKLTLIYDLKNSTLSTLESEPAVMLSQNLSYSESDAGVKYRSGQWNGKLTSGITENSLLETSLQYTLVDKAMVIDDFSWKYLLNDRASLVTFYREQGSSLLSKLGVRQVKGIAWDYSAQGAALGPVEVSPVVIDANSDGIFNIYDEYGSFVKTTPAVQGINRIELPQNIKGNFVRVDLVVVGEVRESFEFPIVRSGETGNAVRLEVGMAESHNNVSSQQSKKSTPFVQATGSSKNFTVGVSAVSEANQFAASATFRGFKHFQFGAESTFKNNLKQHDLFANYSNSFYNVNYFINVAKSFSDNSKLTLSTGASRHLIGNARIDLYYNQSSSNYNGFTAGASSKQRYSKTVEYKMLSMKFSSRFQTNYGVFDYNISASTDLGQEKRLGLSVSYRPASRSKYFKPTAGIQFDKHKSYSFVSNEMRVSDSLRFTPEVRFTNSALTQYGTAISYMNEKINTDTSFYKTTAGHDFYINATSNTFISRAGIKNSGDQKNVAYRFVNTHQSGVSQQSVNFNVNGDEKKMKNGDVLYDYSGDGKVSQIYSQTPSVSLNDKYNSGVVKPFRLYNVEYTHEADKLIVSGRVFDGLRPLAGVAVLNHVGKTTSDKNGYFSLQVSRMEPVI
ncbi:hypothetical protein C3N28_004593, partial [Salmonella enterica subsp. enterica serovar Javiana]|nr:hypothetical protein [Salmonella enterica subsp. enterica serovar Javiana]